MKRVFALFLIILLVLQLGACGGSAGTTRSSQKATAAPTEAETTAAPTEEAIKIPSDTYQIFKLLNDNTPDEDFEKVWEACMAKIEQTGKTEAWDQICHSLSGLMDEYNGSLLYRLREEYSLKLFSTNNGSDGHYRNNVPSKSNLESYVKENKLNPLLTAKMYREGCCLDFGGTIWLPEEYNQAMEAPGPVDESDIRKPGEAIRILVVDKSWEVRGYEITQQLLLNDAERVKWIIDRDQTVYKGLFSGGNKKKVMLTSYPQLADVVLEINTTYPSAGQYKYSNGTTARVWNTVVTLTAYDMRGEQPEQRTATATFRHEAGKSVTVSGGSKIYLKVPDLTKEEYKADAQTFADTIFSWFPDLAQ